MVLRWLTYSIFHFFLGTFYFHFSSLTFQPPKPAYQFQKPVSNTSFIICFKISFKPLFKTSFKNSFKTSLKNQYQKPVSKTSFKKPVSKTSFKTCFKICFKTSFKISFKTSSKKLPSSFFKAAGPMWSLLNEVLLVSNYSDLEEGI